MATKKKTSKVINSKKSVRKKNSKTSSVKSVEDYSTLKVVGGQEKTVKAAASVLSNNSNDAVDSGARVIENVAKKNEKSTPKTSSTKKDSSSSVNKISSNISQKSDDISSIVNDAINRNQEQIEAVISCANKGSDVSRDIGEIVSDCTSKWLDKQIEVSKELMECRTFNDLFELQSRVVSENIENLFDESMQISEVIVGYATEVSEPFQKNVSEVIEKVSKSFSA